MTFSKIVTISFNPTGYLSARNAKSMFLKFLILAILSESMLYSKYPKQQLLNLLMKPNGSNYFPDILANVVSRGGFYFCANTPTHMMTCLCTKFPVWNTTVNLYKYM